MRAIKKLNVIIISRVNNNLSEEINVIIANNKTANGSTDSFKTRLKIFKLDSFLFLRQALSLSL